MRHCICCRGKAKRVREGGKRVGRGNKRDETLKGSQPWKMRCHSEITRGLGRVWGENLPSLRDIRASSTRHRPRAACRVSSGEEITYPGRVDHGTGGVCYSLNRCDRLEQKKNECLNRAIDMFKRESGGRLKVFLGSPDRYSVLKHTCTTLLPIIAYHRWDFHYVRTGTTSKTLFRGFLAANAPSNSSMVRCFVSTKKK